MENQITEESLDRLIRQHRMTRRAASGERVDDGVHAPLIAEEALDGNRS